VKKLFADFYKHSRVAKGKRGIGGSERETCFYFWMLEREMISKLLSDDGRKIRKRATHSEGGNQRETYLRLEHFLLHSYLPEVFVPMGFQVLSNSFHFSMPSF